MLTGHRRILPVVLAGGTGTRLWPVSTSNLPKQFQPLLGASSTYEKVLRRLSAAALFEEPVVITALPFQSVAAEQASRAGVRPHIVLEPVRRDSAAAIAAAALLAMAKRADQPVLVVAADHAIDDDSAFIATVQRGMKAAETDGSIVVFGLRPDSPRTSFGYIKPGAERTAGGEVLNVDAFVEKPDLATAERYVAAGYLWNSGNFLFRADAMVDAFRTHAPDVLLPVSEAIEKGTRLGDSLLLHQESFSQARATSVDYAIMEKASNIVVVPGNFAWSDVGSWDAVWQMLPHDQRGNATVGMGQVFDADNTLVHAQNTLTVAAGVKDLAVITTEDAVLVFPRARSQDVKDIARNFERITFASRQEVDFPRLSRPNRKPALLSRRCPMSNLRVFASMMLGGGMDMEHLPGHRKST